MIHDSKIIVMAAMRAIPAINAINCFTDSFESSSFSKSGRTVTNEMCKKPPAVNGIIQDVRASKAFVTFVPPTATSAPSKPVPAVKSCALAASQRLKPDRKRIAKSPTSCGISCTVTNQNTHMVIVVSLELNWKGIGFVSYIKWQRCLKHRDEMKREMIRPPPNHV